MFSVLVKMNQFNLSTEFALERSGRQGSIFVFPFFHFQGIFESDTCISYTKHVLAREYLLLIQPWLFPR